MPSSNQTVLVAAMVVGLAIVAYSVVVQQVLFGVFLAALVYLFGWVVSHFPGTVSETFGRQRAVVTGVLVVLVLGYSLLVTANLVLGVVVALTITFVSWVTVPGGPVARWLAER
ncbi:hypothetical protein ACFQJD_09085 [Haloplanus sp. GCM10025708]|uniref:hypothetical protein n=1 Tax=Haloferacaceae TaxID=1644056 RepID=UPI0036161086